MSWTTLSERIRLLLQPGLRSVAERAAPIRALPLKVVLGAPEIEPGWRAAEARIATVGLTAESGMNPGDRRALYYLMRYLRPQRVLEIGTQAGASAIHLAAGLADAHSGPTVRRLLTVDIKDVNHSERAAWRDFKLPQSPRDAMRKLGYDELVEFRVARSLELLRTGGEAYDLIFLDGDHRFKTVLAEIPAALARLKPGGLVLLHDFFPGLKPLWSDGKVIDGPQRAVDVLRQAGWPIEVAAARRAAVGDQARELGHQPGPPGLTCTIAGTSDLISA